MMKTAVRWALLCCCALPAPAQAQTPQDARVTISHPGIQTMKEDLKTLLGLTSPAEQKQIPVLEDFIDIFATGLDPARPLSVQMLPGIKPTGYLAILPLEGGFQPLRENMEALGYEVSRDARDTSLYQFRLIPDPDAAETPADPAAPDEVGWLRVLPKAEYAVGGIAGSRNDLPLLRELALQTAVPEFDSSRIAHFEFSNPDPSPAAQQHRREKYQWIRQPAVDAVQKRPSESQAVFQLRRSATSALMDEGERTAAEAQQLVAQLSIDTSDPQKPVLNVSGELLAIAGTGLDSALKTFNSTPDAFAALPRLPGSALSIRINHPIDEMRQKNLSALLDLLQQDVAAKLESRDSRSESEKEAISKVVAGIITHLKTGIQSGWLNFYSDAAADGKDSFNSVTAYTSPNTTQLADVLPLMSGMSPGSKVDMNVETIGDVAVHRVRLEKGLLDVLDLYFGTERDVYVGIGPKIVWMASGDNAVEQLKRSIATAGEPKPTTSPLHIEASLLPWTRQTVNFYAKVKPPTVREELDRWRAAERSRARAIEAFSKGNDTLTIHCEFEDGRLKTNVRLDAGVLRFIAKQIASFSKDNLDTK